MTNNNEKKTVRIPVPAEYAKDTMIAGVKKDELKIMWFGEIPMRVFFTEVPADQAKALLSLTWAEVDYDKPERRRKEKGIIDCDISSVEAVLESDGRDDPLQFIIDNEAIIESQKMIDYLEGVHEHFGDIFRERLNGSFSSREMERNLGIPETSIRRWSKEVTRLAMDYYFKLYF